MEDLYRSQFRLPYPLYERLADAAKAQGRSLNAEVVARLQQSIEGAPAGASVQEEVRAQIAQLALALGERMGQMEAGLKSYVDEAVASVRKQK